MGQIDARRQALNVARMRMLGAEVVEVTLGDKILKDAINEALRDWVTNVKDTHYLLGTVAGPHPFPAMVRDFHAQKETERVILRLGWRAGGAEPLLGSPVLFGSGHFDALRALPEGKGGGVVIRQHPGCVRAVYAQSAEELEDADTVERLEALKRFL